MASIVDRFRDTLQVETCHAKRFFAALLQVKDSRHSALQKHIFTANLSPIFISLPQDRAYCHCVQIDACLIAGKS